LDGVKWRAVDDEYVRAAAIKAKWAHSHQPLSPPG
jgi:hypothetical protein